MSTAKDPLVRYRSVGPDRLNYVLGVALDAEDLSEEQLYHRGRLARALKYLFGVGTVAGLEVVWDDPEIVVQPGLALDPLGRLIEIPRPACIRLQRWFDAEDKTPEARTAHRQNLRDAWVVREGGGDIGDVVADVFARFVVCPRGKTPAFATGPFDATNAVADARLRDGYRLDLVLREDAALGPVPNAEGVVENKADAPRPDARTKAAEIQGDPEATLQSRLRRMESQILRAWRDDTSDWDTVNDRPRALSENPLNIDPTAVLLARLRIPANGANPELVYLGEQPEIDNHVRRFVYAPGVLTQLPEEV